MNTLTSIAQSQAFINVAGLISIIAFCVLTTVLIGRFKYIWTVELGNRWFGKEKAI
jgi:hypothetical protein